MTIIVKEYSSLSQYAADVKNNTHALKPKSCALCGTKTLYLNGSYHRKSQGRGKDATPAGGLSIQRFKCSCSDCEATYSVLPSLLSPLRWYLWCMQEWVLSLFIDGRSIKAISHICHVGRSTVLRWINWSKSKWQCFCNELLVHEPQLSGVKRWFEFYLSLFRRRSLSHVMCHLQRLGVTVP